MGVSERSRMRKCEAAAHVVPATEMRRVKAVASAMEMAPTMEVASTMASATMTTASVASAMASAASAQRGVRQHNR